MEHLPKVSKLFEPLLIPYVADRDSDGLAFARYPKRQGFDLGRILTGDFEDASSVASMAQAFAGSWVDACHSGPQS